jgi:hypothetical protein
MPILNVQLNQPGQAGVFPALIYIATNDTLATVTTVGYLNTLVDRFGISLNEADIALVTTKPSPHVFETQVGWLAVTRSGSDWSLTPTTAPSDVNAIIGTQNQILANGTYGVPAIGDVTLTLAGLASFSWVVVTGTTENMLSNKGYIVNNVGLVTLNLPATSLVGDEIDVLGKGAGGWLIQCGSGQTIVLGTDTTSSGGTLASTNDKDSLYIVCTVANTEWQVGAAPQGNITVS